MEIKVIELSGSSQEQERTLNAFTKDFWELISIVHDGYAKGKVTAYLRKNQIDSAPAIPRHEPLTTRESAPNKAQNETQMRPFQGKPGKRPN